VITRSELRRGSPPCCAVQADVALLMVPADGNFTTAIQKGDHKAGEVQGQTRQHARLLNLLGVKQLLCGVNKMVRSRLLLFPDVLRHSLPLSARSVSCGAGVIRRSQDFGAAQGATERVGSSERRSGGIAQQGERVGI
jgi:hypothetical protein